MLAIVALTIIAMFIVIYVFNWLKTWGCRYPYVGTVRKDGSIFVSIASYRDSSCSDTVRELYEKARDPNLVFIGLVEQNKSSSEACLFPEGCSDRIRRVNLSHRSAKGPCYARHLASCLYNGEEFFFQIDSHTRFEEGWDTDLKLMSMNPPSEKTVFSHYPQSWYNINKGQISVNDTAVPLSGFFKYSAHNINHDGKSFKKGVGVAGGFMFMRGEVLMEVPFDPRLEWVFNGEEFLYSARLFTRGYEFYSPSHNVAYHYYKRDGEPRFQRDHVYKERDAYKTVISRIQSPPPGYFGTAYTAKDYIEFLKTKVK